MKKLLLITTLFLSSCGILTPPTSSVIIDGVPIVYRSAPLAGNLVGLAQYFPQHCQITVDLGKIKGSYHLANVLAHEYAHCVDHFKVLQHNGITSEGIVFGNYFANPVEGYAQFYATDYVNRCGTNISVFKSPFADNIEPPCDLVDPRSIQPMRP